MIENRSFEALLNREFRWPYLGGRPFTPSRRWQDNAYIDLHGHGRLVMMMTGYKKAADLMVERAATDQPIATLSSIQSSSIIGNSSNFRSNI